MPRNDSNSPMTGLSANFRSIAFRRSFSRDPINTLANVGIDAGGLSRPVIDSLVRLSSTELETLADLQDKFEGAEDVADFTGGVIF